MTPEIPYKRKAVDPLECIKTGWELVKPHYWLFVGMCFVGFFIGSAVPLGILMGPMLCGIYLTIFARRRRDPSAGGAGPARRSTPARGERRRPHRQPDDDARGSRGA